MTALLVEATAALVLPCSATVAVTSVLLVVAGRARWAGALASTLGLVTGAFLAVGWAPRLPPVALGLALAAGAVLAHRRPDALGLVGAGLAGAAAGLLWQPCVGSALGDVLTAAVRAPWAELVPIAGYVSVLTLPGWVLAGIGSTGPGGPVLRHPAARVTALGLAVVLAGAVAVGLGDDLTGMLVRWST